MSSGNRYVGTGASFKSSDFHFLNNLLTSMGAHCFWRQKLGTNALLMMWRRPAKAHKGTQGLFESVFCILHPSPLPYPSSLSISWVFLFLLISSSFSQCLSLTLAISFYFSPPLSFCLCSSLSLSFSRLCLRCVVQSLLFACLAIRSYSATTEIPHLLGLATTCS